MAKHIRLITLILLGIFIFTADLSATVERPIEDAIKQRITETINIQSNAAKWQDYLTRDPRSMQNYDVTYYKIDLDLDFSSQEITGDNLIGFTILEDNVNSILVDFTSNLDLDGIYLEDQLLTYIHQDHQIEIELGQTYDTGSQLILNLKYHGHPVPPSRFNLGLLFSEHDGEDIAFTLVEPYASRDWWPCKDVPADKAESADIWITCPEQYICASNGILTETLDNGDGTKTFKWYEDYPIATYLVSIAVTNYEIFSETYEYGNSQMEILNYVFPEQYDQSVQLFSQTPLMMDFLSEVYCPYPFLDEKYGHAVYPGGGAMEHQTCTSFGSDLVAGYSDYTILHELAHQWAGDLITCETWAHIWLNEGFATYSEVLWSENLGGIDSYHFHIDALDLGGDIDDKLERDEGGSGNYILDIVVYFKGAWVLHMLRGIVGEEVLSDILNQYVLTEELRYGTATTEDFTEVVEDVSGIELSWFFDQWFQNYGRPVYEYAGFTCGQNDSIKVTLRAQGSHDEPFDMFVPLRIGENDYSVWAQDGYNRYTFQIDDISDSLAWDPDNWVLDYGYEEQLPVLLENPNVRDNSIMLFWQPYFDPEIAGMNIYRSDDGSEYERLNDQPVTGSSYADDSVDPGSSYYYKINAVMDPEGQYTGKFSNVINCSTVEFSFDQGILIVDKTHDYPQNSPFPSDEDVDGFYAELLEDYEFTEWDVSTLGEPPLVELARYSTVIWQNDDIMNQPFSGNALSLRSYLMAGGNLLLSSWKNIVSIPADFSRGFLGFDNSDYCEYPIFQQGTGLNDFPDLTVDPDKVLPNWNGCLQYVAGFSDLDGAEVVYSFDALDDDPEWEGQTCGILGSGAYNTVILGFPLYYIQQPNAQFFMDKVMEYFSEQSDNGEQLIQTTDVGLSNYPNPFNPETVISFQIQTGSDAALYIYNIKGQLVRILYEGYLPAGIHKFSWDGRNSQERPVESGIYLYQLKTDKQTRTKKMILMK